MRGGLAPARPTQAPLCLLLFTLNKYYSNKPCRNFGGECVGRKTAASDESGHSSDPPRLLRSASWPDWRYKSRVTLALFTILSPAMGGEVETQQ